MEAAFSGMGEEKAQRGKSLLSEPRHIRSSLVNLIFTHTSVSYYACLVPSLGPIPVFFTLFINGVKWDIPI